MDRDRQRQIASQGGKTAHKLGTAHEWDHAAAREAGRKGGLATARNRTNNQAPTPEPTLTE